MSITPMISPMVASPRPNASWQLATVVPCTTASMSATGHGINGFSGIDESKRLDPGSSSERLT